MHRNSNITGNPISTFHNAGILNFGRLEYVDNQHCYSHKNTFTFTGKERDEETGYSYFGARYYDSDLSGLFLSVDPMADKYPNISPYAYCAWNPVKLVDPEGEEIWIKGNEGNYYMYRDGKLYTSDGKLYAGNDKFAIKVCSDLSSLKNKGLNKSISRMERSRKKINIIETHGDNETTSLNKKGESRWYIGSGSNICYNPNKKETNDGERDPMFGLAHELGHAYDAMRGKIDDTKCAVYKPIDEKNYLPGEIPYSEIRAVRYENKARPNDNQRTTYDGFELNFYLEQHEGSINDYYGFK